MQDEILFDGNNLENKSNEILFSLNGLSVDQAKRILNLAITNLDLSSTVDLAPINSSQKELQ